MATTPKIILASGSPYRQALLHRLGLDFEAVSPDIAETPLLGEMPAALAVRLALEKARAVANRRPGGLVIGSDQVAVLEGRPLTKPGHREGAVGQLRRASGRRMEFFTAVCVLDAATGEARTELDLCSVQFRPLSDGEIERYVDREQPFDCAGSFKSEGLGIALFERFQGDDPNALIGLPLIRLVRLLEGFGVPVP
jgi:septum formation protein